MVALLGLLHIWITLLGLVLGGGRGGYKGGVEDDALAQEQAPLGQAGIDLLEDPLSQGALIQLMAESQQLDGIGHALDGQVDTHEVAHRLAGIEGILQRFIGQSIPLLEEVDAQPTLQPDRRRPRLPAAFGK